MKKTFLLLALTLYLAGSYYLTRSDPVLPDLDESVRSDEPGDSWQHPDQKAFYTYRDSRPEILGELQRKFSLLDSWTNRLAYRLNYRPEEVGELVRDQLRSYYLEEVVHPLRESMYINVWQPDKSPALEEKQREAEKMYFKEVFYPVKVTLRPQFSSPFPRLLVWTFIFPLSYLVFQSLKKAFNEK